MKDRDNAAARKVLDLRRTHGVEIMRSPLSVAKAVIQAADDCDNTHCIFRLSREDVADLKAEALDEFRKGIEDEIEEAASEDDLTMVDAANIGTLEFVRVRLVNAATRTRSGDKP